MKKLMKKLIAMVAALVMIVTLLPAMGVNAAAEGKVIITKNDTNQGEDGDYGTVAGAQFTFYKIASYDEGEDGYANWTVEEDFTSLNITEDDLGNLSTAEIESKVDDAMAIINAEDSQVEPAVVSGYTDETGQVEVTIRDRGYYLVVETITPTNYVASKPFFVAMPSANNYNNPNAPATGWTYIVEVAPKNEEIPPIEKEADVTSAGLGQSIDYTITGPAVPTYDSSYDDTTLKYTITDTLSEGLTLDLDENNAPTIKVYKSSADDENNLLAITTDYTLTGPTNNEDGTTTFSVSLTQSTIKDLAGEEIIVTYSATVNENAVVGEDAITNEAKLEYTNSPNTTYEGDPVTNKVYSFKIRINKTGENNAALEGATFGLYKDAECTEANKIAQATSGANGLVEFKDIDGNEITLANITYYLKEISAPNGYTILATPFEVEIKDDTTDNKQDYDFSYSLNNEADKAIGNDGIIIVNVHNNKGFNLPATGGMGTYLFTIGGIVIMAGAAFALIAMKKRA